MRLIIFSDIEKYKKICKHKYKHKFKSPAMNIDAPLGHGGEPAVANKLATSVLSRPGRTVESAQLYTIYKHTLYLIHIWIEYKYYKI